ncbi:hypothetical protein PMAYCL1PPCAC_13882, partial [Pristionchus mayeri]
ESQAPMAGDELARLPWLRDWSRSNSAIVFHLSNGTVQINFFKDHTKLVLCPLLGAVSVIDSSQNMKVFKLALLKEHGCTKEMHTKLNYAKSKCEKFMKDGSTAKANKLLEAFKNQ